MIMGLIRCKLCEKRTRIAYWRFQDESRDGRTLSVPLAWYPRLVHGSHSERQSWRFTGKGQGIHWDALDEDISIERLIAGKPACIRMALS
jgi:hypothetical protein